MIIKPYIKAILRKTKGNSFPYTSAGACHQSYFAHVNISIIR